MVLHTQHAHREFDRNCTRRAVLAAGPAVPAFIGVTNVQHIIFQVKHVQRAVLIADATGIAFLVIDYRRHGLTPLLSLRVTGCELRVMHCSVYFAIF